MKNWILTLILLGTVSTASAAEFYIVHGINGADLGLSATLPVDVQIDGACRLTNVPFKTVSQRLEVPAASYEVLVRLSDGTCTGAIVGHTRLDLSINESSTFVAHLSPEGVVKFSKFYNNQQPTDSTKGRVTLRHAAAAGPVDVTYRQRYRGRSVKNLSGGNQNSGEVDAGTYTFRVYSTDTKRRVFTTELPLAADQHLVVYVVGSSKKGSLQAFTQTLSTPAS